MYQAKEHGRGRYEMFDAGLRDRITARLRMEGDLRRALEGEGRLWVAYQPYYRLPGRQVAGVEALVRWEHPERGNIPPADFIPMAEESGLVVPLGAYVLRAACEQVARWQRTRSRPAPDRQRLRPPDGRPRTSSTPSRRSSPTPACTPTRSASRSPSACCSRRRPARR